MSTTATATEPSQPLPSAPPAQTGSGAPNLRRRASRGRSYGVAGGVLWALLVASAAGFAGPADAAPTPVKPTTSPTQLAPAQELTSSVPMSEVIAKAVPAPMPLVKAATPSITGAEALAGSSQQYPGALPKNTAASSSARRVANSTGSVWPGCYNANPNRQTGRLFYYEPRERRWSHCSGTAINTANKSFVLTAGHCVYQSDPDRNGRIDGNGYYYKDLRFCPGYEANKCKLGVWYYRTAATTSSWYYGVGASRAYSHHDDVAVVLVRPNSSGYLVNVVGGQGIRFNQHVGLTRTAFGYPAQDRRWPGTPWHGDNLIYCQGRDTLAQDRTKMWIACRMTGGASGGPWLSGVNNSWLGFVNGVNSHKPYGANHMESPYFDNTEANLFNTYKSR